MEDSFCVFENINSSFSINYQEIEPHSFFGIFDGKIIHFFFK